MKEYAIYESLTSSQGNGDSYVLKEFDNLESAKNYLERIQTEIDDITHDLTNTWKDVIKHFGYAYNSSMQSSLLTFEIHKFTILDDEFDDVIESIEIDKNDFDTIQDYICEQEYKDEQNDDE